MRIYRPLLCGLYMSTFATAAEATVVQFQTSMGAFSVNLYDETTPLTVANFLEYVDQGVYDDSIIHRSVKDFVVQGGGYRYLGDLPLTPVETEASVKNEPVHSNVRATIAMAKLDGKPNSATSQWFINLEDNSLDLDPVNGGFTVFGEVMADDMDIVEAMAKVPVYAVDPFRHFPLRDFDVDGDRDPDETNFIIINSIVVLDAAEDTAAGAEPPPNLLIKTVKKKKGGAGDGLLLGLLVFAASLARRKSRQART